MLHCMTVGVPDGDMSVPRELACVQVHYFHEELRSDFTSRAVACCGSDDETLDVVVAVRARCQLSDNSANVLCSSWETAL